VKDNYFVSDGNPNSEILKPMGLLLLSIWPLDKCEVKYFSSNFRIPKTSTVAEINNLNGRTLSIYVVHLKARQKFCTCEI